MSFYTWYPITACHTTQEKNEVRWGCRGQSGTGCGLHLTGTVETSRIQRHMPSCTDPL